ncbi:hypothetical protein RFI_33802, partial [Reticulomyxa filosa]
IEDLFFFDVTLGTQTTARIDRSELIADELVEHCFYKNKNQKKGLTMKQIIEKSKKLYERYHLDLRFVTTSWDCVKIRVERFVTNKLGGIKDMYVWNESVRDKNDDKSKEDNVEPLPPLDKFLKSMREYYTKRSFEEETDVEPESDSS